MGRRERFFAHFTLINVLFLHELQIRESRNEELCNFLGDLESKVRERTAARFCQKGCVSHHVRVFSSGSQKKPIFRIEPFWNKRIGFLILVGISMDLPDINRKNLAFNNYFVPFSFTLQFYIFSG